MQTQSTKTHQQRDVFVNVASSTCMLEGFINLDNHVLLPLLRMPLVTRRLLSLKHRSVLETYEDLVRRHEFIRHDCRRPLPFGDGSVDHILCSHFLEHVFPNEAELILADFKRALKLGGTVHIVVPDLLEMARRYVQAAGPEAPLSADDFVKETLLSRSEQGSLKFRVLQFLGGYGLDHKWMYDKYSIGQKLAKIGFVLLDENETPSKDFRRDDGSVHVVAVVN